MKKILKKVSLAMFIAGSLFFVNAEANITGAVVGVGMNPDIYYFVGLLIMVSAGLLFYYSKNAI